MLFVAIAASVGKVSPGVIWIVLYIPEPTCGVYRGSRGRRYRVSFCLCQRMQGFELYRHGDDPKSFALWAEHFNTGIRNAVDAVLVIDRQAVDAVVHPFIGSHNSRKVGKVPAILHRSARFHIEHKEILVIGIGNVEKLLVAAEDDAVGTPKISRRENDFSGGFDVVDGMIARLGRARLGEVNAAVFS